MSARSHSSSFYDRFGSLYPIVDVFLKPQKRKFFDIVNESPPGQLLEIGVGNGTHLKHYRNHAITGIDTSEAMLTRARGKAKGVQLLNMNGEALTFANGSFDYVVLSHVIAVVENPDKLFEEVHRVLKPNGRVFILNHITPGNWLRYIDLSFDKLSSLFHFKSNFKVSGVRALQEFKPLAEYNAGMFSYFKILIYEKSL